MIVWVSGATGSGKTTLSNVFASMGWSIVRENIPAKAFNDFAAEPTKFCEPLQRAIIASRLEQFQKLPSGNVVFDRSASEDLAVFCQMHHEQGYIDSAALLRLRELADSAEVRMPPPDLILYLAPRTETIHSRISATHPAIIIRNLPRQIALYQEWVERRNEQVLKIDNTGCATEVIIQLFEGIKNA